MSSPTASSEEATLALSSSPEDELQHLRAGDRVGRYLIEAEIGTGGMGQVYRARDTELARRVALKFVRTGATEGSEGAARIRREAQAMAQLNHPNVVPIYDVHADPKGLHIAMEYVEGQTLRQWLRQAERTPVEVAGAFAAAAAGLAAAHEVGIVHRDFKPSNVLVGEDGRVRVMDFGIARTRGPNVSSEGGSVGLEVSGDAELTEVGRVMGTPAYMAPEQHQGGEVDARSDQYAFCISLWEALFGERPFRGPEMARAKARGVPETPTNGSNVPPALIRLLERGLSPSREQRWPSMNELIVELQRVDGSSRGWSRWLAIAGIVAVVLGGIGLVSSGHDEAAGRCRADRGLARVWDPRVSRSVQDSLVAQGVAAEAVLVKLDEWAQKWTERYSTVCDDEASSDARVFDRSMACLAEQRRDVEARVSVLHDLDREMARHALELVQELPDPGACVGANGTGKLADGPNDPAVRETVAELDREVQFAAALHRAGRHESALQHAEAATVRARSLWPPLWRKGVLVQCRALERLGRIDEALTSCESVLEAATIAGDDAMLVRAVMPLMHLAIVDGRHEEAERLHRLADAAVERAGRGTALEANLLDVLAQLRLAQERRDEAEPLLRQALEIQRHVAGSRSLDVGVLLNTLGRVVADTRRHEMADEILDEALDILESEVGEEHLLVAETISNLGGNALRAGDLRRARDLYLRALHLYRASFGDEHRSVANTLNNLGLIHMGLGELDAAARSLAEARELKEALIGPDTVSVANTLHNEGLVSLHQRRYVDAERFLIRAAETYRNVLGSTSGSTLNAEIHAGWVIFEQGRTKEAIARLEPVVETTRDLPAPAWERALGLLYLGAALERDGRSKEARAALEEAVALYDELDASPEAEGRARFYLGRLLESDDPERARALVERARDGLAAFASAQSTKVHGELTAEIDAWLQR